MNWNNVVPLEFTINSKGLDSDSKKPDVKSILQKTRITESSN